MSKVEDEAAHPRPSTHLARTLLGLAEVRRLDGPAPPEGTIWDMPEGKAAQIVEWAASQASLPGEFKRFLSPYAGPDETKTMESGGGPSTA